MIFSGVDLIRRSGNNAERLAATETVPRVQPSDSTLDEGSSRNALLRFARFIHKDGKRRPPAKRDPRAHHPYLAARQKSDQLDGKGRNLDIFV